MLDDCGPKNECRMLKRLSIVLAVLAATSCSKPFVIVQIADVQMGFAAAALGRHRLYGRRDPLWHRLQEKVVPQCISRLCSPGKCPANDQHFLLCTIKDLPMDARHQHDIVGAIHESPAQCRQERSCRHFIVGRWLSPAVSLIANFGFVP